jgi:hypothetical protein
VGYNGRGKAGEVFRELDGFPNSISSACWINSLVYSYKGMAFLNSNDWLFWHCHALCYYELIGVCRDRVNERVFYYGPNLVMESSLTNR